MGCGLERVPALLKKNPLPIDPGRKANEKERQAALQVAEDFISRMRYAPNTQVRRRLGPHLLLGLFLWPLPRRLDKKGGKSLGPVRNGQASIPAPSSGKARFIFLFF